MASPSKFTDHLLATKPEALRDATQHPFLRQAATGELPQDKLTTWLGQDRLYALSYVTFMGQLLAKVEIPSSKDRTSTLNWRIADCLINCLDNIRTELKLFEDTASEHGWSELLGSATPNVHTRAYKGLFAEAGQPGSTLFIGMLTLWATEKCYLLAWSHAKSSLSQQIDANGSKGDVMQTVFIPNWSSDEFGEFVAQLERLTNEMAQSASEQDLLAAERQWLNVLEAELNFWPPV